MGQCLCLLLIEERTPSEGAVVGVPADSGGGVGDKNSGVAGVELRQRGCSQSYSVHTLVLRVWSDASGGTGCLEVKWCGAVSVQGAVILRVWFGDVEWTEQLRGVAPRAWCGYSYRDVAALFSSLLPKGVQNDTQLCFGSWHWFH